ncbi:MAG TPA: zinc-dependent metalloprotease [Actinomycetota bacterium]
MNDPFDLPPDVLRRIPLFAELAKVLSWSAGPVNWDLARQIAVSVAAGEDPQQQVDVSDATAMSEHIKLAEMWLLEITGLPDPTTVRPIRAVTAVDWAESATTTFAELIDPIALKASRALTEQLGEAGEGDPIQQALSQMGPMLMGIQAGGIVGQLAREVLGTHEVPFPIDEPATLLIVPAIDRVAAEHAVDRRDVRQWVALQAAARRLTLDGVSWIPTHFFALYHNFVATLDLTIAEGLQKLQQLDLSDPARLQEALGEGSLFSSEASPQTAEAAGRVDGFLAVIEAHGTVAVETAAARLGADAMRLAEVFARRDAGAGAGTGALMSFLGLEPETDRRRALAFVRAILAHGDWALLHRVWEDAGSFPSEAELTDPPRWIERMEAA